MSTSFNNNFCAMTGRSETAVREHRALDERSVGHVLPLNVCANIVAFNDDDMESAYSTQAEFSAALDRRVPVAMRWLGVFEAVHREEVSEEYATASGSWAEVNSVDALDIVRYYCCLPYAESAAMVMGAQCYEYARWRLNEGEELETAVRSADSCHMDCVLLPTAGHIARSRGRDSNEAVMRGNRHHLWELKDQIQTLRWGMICMKAFLWQVLVASVPGADAFSINRYNSVLQELGIGYSAASRSFTGQASWFIQWFADLALKAYSTPSFWQLYLEFCLIAVVAGLLLGVLVRYFLNKRELTLAAAETKAPTKFIGKEITTTGTLYKFVHKGELLVVPEDATPSVVPVEEMALPGSDLYPSKKQEVGAILVATEDTELALVGCFWRLGEHLVTARHVANAVNSGIADIYLAGLAAGPRGVCRVNLRNAVRVDKKLFDMESNECVTNLDAHVVKLTQSQWSVLRIGRASTRKSSQYGLTVSAVGFVNGCLMTSAGRTLSDSGVTELWHTASTNKGFSGAPLYCGKSVVGMHVSSAGDKNVAVRIEAISYYSPAEGREDESNIPEIYNDEEDLKYLGESSRYEAWDSDWVVERKGGRVQFMDRQELEEVFPSLKGKKQTYTEFIASEESEREQKAPQLIFGTYDPRKRWADYDDECDKPDVFVVARETAVHCNSSPKEQAVASGWLDANKECLIKLGYDEDKYQYPEINQKLEADSCRNHLKLFAERNRSILRPPSAAEKRQAVCVVLNQMAHNKFEPKKSYRTKDNLQRIINSSAVKDSKSPGHPYQGMGLPLNKDVLKQFTVPGFVETIEREWDEPFDVKVFLKTEPTKQAKLEKGMARVITGLPLHKMVKHQAVFEDMLAAGVANWTRSPVVGGYAPQVAGHIENLVKRFVGKTVYESDKTNWDYMYYDYLFEMLEDVLVELAVRDDTWEDSEWERYITDIRNSVKEVSHGTRYRCTNGDVYQSKYAGAMNSGWLLTFFGNSIGQLLLHALVAGRMGVTSEQLLSDDYAILAGGDDVLQTFPGGFDGKKYVQAASELGFELSDFVVHKSFDGCEFFSSKLYKKDGIWQFAPLRFTKHVASLRTQKLEDLGSALASHMLNYVWDVKRFVVFERMFKELRRQHPDHFPLHYLKTRMQLQMQVKGFEADC